MNILNSIIFFGAPHSEIYSDTLKSRVNVERTKIYFKHTKMSLVSLFLGLIIGIYLLITFQVSWILIVGWGLALSTLGITLFSYEHFVKKQTFTPKNITSLIGKRLIITFFIALVWGLFIQLMPDSSKLGYTLSYIAMSTFIHIGFLSYSIIPLQFLINFVGVLFPFEIELINEYLKTNDLFFAIIAMIFVLCEGILFIKALVNAQTAIHTIILQEKLKNEATASSEAKKQIEYLAYHDQLTGAWNRHYIQMQLETLHKQAKAFGIILLDINYFKQINDTYGHSFGDAFLIQFVQTLQSALPRGALLGRFGGDEFIVLLPKCSNTILEETKLTLKTLLDKTYIIDTTKMNGSTSIGTALYPQNAKDIEALIHFADKSMYADKHNDHLKNS